MRRLIVLAASLVFFSSFMADDAPAQALSDRAVHGGGVRGGGFGYGGRGFAGAGFGG